MALPRVGVSIGITLNSGNYESVRADARFDIDVEPGETVKHAFENCLHNAKEELDAALDGVEAMLRNRKTTRKTTPAPAPPGPRGPMAPHRGR